MDMKSLRDAVKAAVEQMERALHNLDNPQEGADVLVLQGKFDEAREAHTAAVAKLDRATAVEEARAAIPTEAAPAPADDEPEGRAVEVGPGVRVGKEPLTYERHSPHSIFSDMYRASQGDPAARGRLDRHREESRVTKHARGVFNGEERANPSQTLGEGGELIAPEYLQDEWIALPRAHRPIADSLNKQGWLPTNSINLPKVKSGTTVAVQTDLGAVSSTAITTELVTGVAQTLAGQQDVAQSLVDLSYPGVDKVIFDDLTRAYDTQQDIKVIEGTVTNAKGINQLTGTNSVTFTEATPKVSKFFSKLAEAIAKVNTGIFAPPTVIAMTPLRWAWLLASVDTAERPLFTPVGQPGFNALGLQERVAAESIVGSIMGLPVVIDASIPQTLGAGTNQDEVYVYRADQLYLWESTPTLRIFPEVLSNKLEVRFQLYGYYTPIFGRLPKAISKIGGTGLAAPTF